MRPRLLDLFCGAGGAAMGYHRAGFDVLGVDTAAQPRYPFDFARGDALTILRDWIDGDTRLELGDFAAIHASPPCQRFSTASVVHTALKRERYPDLLAPTRALLRASGLPYVIENVRGAPLLAPARICGSSLGLDLERHRLFETNWLLLVPPCTHGWQRPRFRSLDRRRKRLARVVGVHGHANYAGERELRERAMGIDWMRPAELVQAIPPDYTELIGAQLLTILNAREEVPA